MQDSSCRSLNIFAFDLGPRALVNGLGACSYPSITKQAIVENTSKEIILYSINKQDNYALVHKNAIIERRFAYGSFPEYLVGIVPITQMAYVILFR